jgi:hypothetical protein
MTGARFKVLREVLMQMSSPEDIIWIVEYSPTLQKTLLLMSLEYYTLKTTL